MSASRSLTFYTKTGCHLCDDARDFVREVAAARGYRLHEIDILEDPPAYRRYHERIPVVTSGDTVVVEGRFTERALHAALSRQEDAHVRGS